MIPTRPRASDELRSRRKACRSACSHSSQRARVCACCIVRASVVLLLLQEEDSALQEHRSGAACMEDDLCRRPLPANGGIPRQLRASLVQENEPLSSMAGDPRAPSDTEPEWWHDVLPSQSSNSTRPHAAAVAPIVPQVGNAGIDADSDTDWLEEARASMRHTAERLGRELASPPWADVGITEFCSSASSAPAGGVGSSVPAPWAVVGVADAVRVTPALTLALASAPAGGIRRLAPPSMIAIREERLQREKVTRRQDEQRQRDIWDRQQKRKLRCSPEARRSGRKESEILPAHLSSRSRSPHACQRIARDEASDIPGVSWEYYIDHIDPSMDVIASRAQAAIHAWSKGPRFYVGVSRYLRRRWYGGDNLSFEEAHCSKWAELHVLSTHSCNVNVVEDELIQMLKRKYGSRCDNIRGGGGGASRCKPNVLYICVGRLSPNHGGR